MRFGLGKLGGRACPMFVGASQVVHGRLKRQEWPLMFMVETVRSSTRGLDGKAFALTLAPLSSKALRNSVSLDEDGEDCASHGEPRAPLG